MDALYLFEGSCDCDPGAVAELVRISLARYLREKLEHRGSDFVGMGFQREMAGVEKLDCRVGIVAAISFGSGRDEKHIVLSPYGEEGRLVLTEVGLKFRVHLHV